MTDSNFNSKAHAPRRAALLLLLVSLAAVATGCGVFSAKRTVSVAPVLAPLVKAEMAQLFAEINRAATPRSVRGKIDVQFLDTSFAECGVVDKYRTAEGDVIIQRPGQVYLSIKAPFGVKIAEMTSDGSKFWVAVYQGEERFRRFVHGTNAARYGRISDDGNGTTTATAGDKPDCGGGKRDEKTMQRTVSSLSSLRPQHLTDALMVPPVAAAGSSLIYAQSESFEEEPDTRPGAKKDARVVRGYYVLVELEPAGEGRARVTRRFWFDRVGALRLARVQNYDVEGQLMTDVVYRDPRPFGAGGQQRLPATVELTRPQDRYSIRISFQTPEEAVIDKQFDPDIFILQNTSDLKEVDLDKQQK
ncbi:MAG TPA: hypothetical protein VF240_01135 [Pyrinomonadaceae bacterium]